MVISARSKSPFGPWENSPFNPVIRAKSNKDKWWSVGHATIFEDACHSWWMILHGYEKGHYNMDRQTMLAPVVWTEDRWFKVPGNFKIDEPVKKPEGDAIGGLVLFYSPKAFSGILADKENVLANLRGWQFPAEKNVINGKVSLRLENKDNTVDMYYSTDDTHWAKIENSVEISDYHLNVLSDFLSLRIGLVAMGEGKVYFKNFRYEPVHPE